MYSPLGRRSFGSAQDATQTADVYSEQLWEDIDLQENSPFKDPDPCNCQNPFCENHSTDRDDLTEEWAAMAQKPKEDDKAVPPTPPEKTEEPSKPDFKLTAPPQTSSMVLDKPTLAADSLVGSFKLSTTPKKSTLWHTRKTLARDDLLFLSVVPPPSCTSSDCPLNQSPYNITHSMGPYVHNGQSMSLVLGGMVSKYWLSIIDDFGGSLPPLGIWKAYERVVKRKGDVDDREIVKAFFERHCTAEAVGRLEKIMRQG